MADLFVTGYWYYYAQLPRHMKPVYMSIYNGLKARRSDITFTVEKHDGVYPNYDNLLQIFKYVLNDNPALYYVDATNSYIYAPSGLSDKARITYTDYYTPTQCAEMERELCMRLDPILSHLRSRGTEYLRVYDLYRYMLATLSYDFGISKENTLKNLESRTIVGPLLRRECVCAGYTKLFKLICDQLGIGCFYIGGTAKGVNSWGNHGWNMVYLQGNFYHIDVTFDSTTFHNTGKYTFEYYLRGDQKMLEDHKWDRAKFPVIVSDYL